MKYLFIALMFFLVSCGGSEANKPQERLDWGAVELKAEQKVDREWVKAFENAFIVSVSSTIEEALTKCPRNDHCILLIDQLLLNGSVYLDRPKTKLLGKAGNRITRNASSGGAFFSLESGLYDIVFENLNIDGESINYENSSVYGFYIEGEYIENIAFLKNQIHHLSSQVDAHGIAIYGTGLAEDAAINNILIDENVLHHLQTGFSESIAINSNVKRWEINSNKISHVSNIAIDVIGGEGISPVRIVSGRVLPGVFDAARYGTIEGNIITDVNTELNPAYGYEHSWAGAIYIDGGHHVYIANNTVIDSEWAYEIGAENCVKTSHIFMEDNVARRSYFGDFIAGAYREIGYQEDESINCDPNSTTDDVEGHGYVSNLTVRNNRFETYSPRIKTIRLENRVRKSIIIQSGVVAQHPDGKVIGDENSIRTFE